MNSRLQCTSFFNPIFSIYLYACVLFLFMRGCVWMGWNVWMCVCVCVWVQGRISPPSLFLLLSLFYLIHSFLIDVLLIDPVAVRAAPLREASRDPSPCALTGPGGALLPFGSPWGSQRQQKETYLTLAPRLLRPQLLLLLLPLLFPCFYSAVLTKNEIHNTFYTFLYIIYFIYKKRKKQPKKN